MACLRRCFSSVASGPNRLKLTRVWGSRATEAAVPARTPGPRSHGVFRDRRAEACILAWFGGSMVPRLRRLGACLSSGPGDPGSAATGPAATIYGELPMTGSVAHVAGSRPAVTGRIAREFVHVVRGLPLSEREESRLARCLDSLPARSHIHAIGVVLGRRRSAMRLCIAGLHPRDIEGYVSAVGASCDTEILKQCIADIKGLGRDDKGPTLVHIDVGANVGERVGLEYKLDEGTQEHGGLATCRLLRWLSGEGLCSAARIDALLDWPAVLRIGSGDGGREFLVRRRVDTVKVSVAADSVTTKAYLMHRTRALEPGRSGALRQPLGRPRDGATRMGDHVLGSGADDRQ